MKVKRYPIQVWFLSEDLQQSAQWHSNKQLVKSISGCMAAMVCARFYFIGIRNMTTYKWFFDKVRKEDTMERFFPLWPLKVKPAFNSYKARLPKWTRMCKEHYQYLSDYLEILLNEYSFRYGKLHGLQKFLDWDRCDAPELKMPIGNLKSISVPWKVLNPRYRDKDICKGYRKQYKAQLQNEGIAIDSFKKRDIPEWLLDVQSHWLE